jgi:hypothetical protein
VLLAVLAIAVPVTVAAHEALVGQLPKRGDFTTMFTAGVAHARVRDGLLIGHGREETQRLPDGRLRFVRFKTYRQVRHPDTRRLVPLSPPWRVRSEIELGPKLRLLRDHTHLELHEPRDEEIADHFEALFELTESLTKANAAGTELARVTRKNGRVVERQRYAYPRDAVPIEIVGAVIAFSVASTVERFEFDVLLPGGATHGIEADVHRVRSVAPFVEDYAVPVAELDRQGPLAVVDLRLSSPFKHLFYPHHFYLAFDADEPSRLVAMWGGDPDEDLQAFRVPKPD